MNLYEEMSRDELLQELKKKQTEATLCPGEIDGCQELFEQRVLDRTAVLEAAIREQESFSYSVSHDLRAPLRHINSFSAILIADYAAELPAEARDFLERICAASNKMGALIDHLLNLSKVASADIKMQNVNLSKMVTSTLRMFQETEPDHCVELIVEQGVMDFGDRTLLRQLFQNLLGNAWKYTSKKQPARIQFGRALHSGREAYFVKDNGAGFDMAYGDKMFCPFERLHGTEYEGIGIGLATVRRIIERHGGTIWAEGIVGEGATFYFTLRRTC